MSVCRSLGVGKIVFIVLAAILLVSGSSIAYKTKDSKSTLDDHVYISSILRVPDTVSDTRLSPAVIPNLAAVNSMLADLGPAWSLAMELRSGRPTLIEGGAIPWIPGPGNTLSWESFGGGCRENSCISASDVEPLARQFIAQYSQVFLLDGYDLVLDKDGSGPVWNSLYFLRFQPYFQGVIVKGASVIFRINNGNLIQVVVDKVGRIPSDAMPVLTLNGAWKIMYGHLGGEGTDEVIENGALEFVPVTPKGLDPEVFNGKVGSMLEYALVWRFSFQRKGVQGTWEALVDARTGDLLRFVDSNRYGHIHGGIRPSDGIPPEENRPFPWCDTGLASPNNYTDGAGNFTGNNATSTLVGKYAHISDACGAISMTTTTGDMDFITDNSAGTDCVVPPGNTGGLGNTHSSRTMFYNLTAINLKAQIYAPGNTWLTSTYMTANVNGSPLCNASSGGGVVNFYQHVAGSCNNLGEIPGVAMHEWAHGYDSSDGSGGQSPPLETYADWTAIIQTHNSCTGAGFFIGGTCGGYGDPCVSCTGVRDCDYTQHQKNTPWTAANHGSTWSCGGGSYNGPCGWEDHCESGISTQALWDFVYRDLTQACPGGPMCNNGFTPMDITSAWMLEDRLWFTGVQTLTAMYTCSSGATDGCSGTVLYSVMRALDDDGDGTANGTPHAHAIYHAMLRHGIACSTYNDTSPQNQNQTSCPALTTPTLSAVAGSNQAILNWTTGGTNATRYFVYRNESGCDVAFNRIAIVNAPTLTYTDNGVVNGTTYYYRVQAVTANDSCSSPSSNCLSVTPQPCAGSVSLNRALYACADQVDVTVLDSTISAPVQVKFWSSTDGTQKTLTLANNPPGSAIYTGHFHTVPSGAAADQVNVSNGATLTVRYTDPDYCGTPNHDVDTAATVDCLGPVISNVLVTAITDSTATVTWTTNEAANSRVTYGTSTPPGTNKDDLTTYVTSHSVILTGLAGCTDYYFSVTSADVPTNSTTDTNGGAYYHFKTYGRVFAMGPDDVEGGNLSWAVSGTASNTWHHDTCRANSATHAWKAGKNDSPACSAQYDINVDTYLTWNADITLGAAGHGLHLRWMEWYATESGYDWCTPQISVNGGTSWTDLMIHYAGNSGGWIQKDIDLAAYTGGTVRIRFWFHSDVGINGEGWYLDDISISKAAACGPELRHQSHTVTDTCSAGGAGNNNGVLDAGETAIIQVTAVNQGTQPATGVTATLATATAGVTITDNTASFPDIANGAAGSSLSPHFAVSVDSGVACGTVINFSIHFMAGSEFWDDAFMVTVGTLTPATATPINETFATGDPPAGWTRTNAGTGTQQWTTTNPGVRGTPSGMTSPFEIIDSDLDGSGLTQDDSLITPAFDTTGATKVELIFDTYYNDYDANDFAYVDVSTNGGGAWTNRITWTTDIGSVATASHQVLDITALAGTGTNRKVRFHYVGLWGYYWLVDNVQVVVTRTPTCSQTVCTGGPPAPPTNLAATPTCASVNLSWTASGGATSYKVLRTTNSNCTSGASQIGNPTGTVYSDTTANPGTTYYYTVIASNGSGDSGISNCANAARYTTPGNPTGLTAGGTCDSVDLSWNNVSGATNYKVFRTTNIDCVTGASQIGNPSARTFSDTTAAAGTTYYYTVKANNGNCDGGNSNCASGVRLVAPTPTITGPNANTCPSATTLLSTEAGMSNYQWHVDGTPIGGATGNTYEATASGSYTVSYAAGNGCAGTSAAHAVTITPCLPNIMFDSRGTLTQVTGDGDANIERGEKWSVQVTLANNGNLDATKVMAALSGNGITVCNSPADFGNISAGRTAFFTFEFIVAPTFSPCGNSIGFDISGKTCNELTPAGPDETGVFTATVGQQTPGAPTDAVIQPSTADAWVDEQNPTTNNGTGTVTDVRRRNNRNHRSLIQFSLAGIPAGSTINSASLELYATAAPGTGQTLDLHHVTATWTESGVTWNTQPTYLGTPDASIAGGTAQGWKVWTVTGVVQAWMSGSYTNNGFLVKCNLETGTTSYLYQFATQENATAANRPLLRVNYTPPPTWDCSYTGAGVCIGAGAPPPVNQTGAGAARFSKGAGETLDVTYDAATCNAQNVIILYNTIGTWTGYADCAQPNGGNSGATTIDSTGQTSVWYNLVWTEGTTAGHPGFASGGPRSWTVGNLCGMFEDDQSRSTCP